MHYRRLFSVIGPVVAAVGVGMIVAAGVAAVYQEWDDALGILAAAGISIAVGLVAWRVVGQRGELTTHEGFATVALSWFAISFAGCLPYLFTGAISGIENAFFETAAGFTTTGASVVPDPGQLGHGVLLWRSLTQWLGGMGIIVLSIAILPLLGVGGVELARAESPGPQPDRLTPRFRETAKRLWLVYVALTGIEVVLLFLGDMSLFESIAHAFTTMSTGGFSTEVGSLGAFSAYSQWVVIAFMAIAGASFALHFRALRDPLVYARNSEFRLYGMILLGATVLLAFGTWNGAVGTVIRDAAFTATSLVTTTGYATADFGQWDAAIQIAIVGLFFVGGMAGSTAGGVKSYRLGVLTSAGRRDLRRLIHPRGVFVVRMGKKPVPDPIVESVQSFFLFYMFIFMTGTLLLGLIESSLGIGKDLVTSASAVASALGNVGPGLAEVGPSGNYLGIHSGGKFLLSGLMIVGRLEIFPVLLLFTRELWRR
ncbi:MAG TPA: TrkH family potassium uptake protein [Acidimicrobiia bacterium]|nr:TrkH family potassium uptake protein [Acidimicrobiia bacterium]